MLRITHTESPNGQRWGDTYILIKGVFVRFGFDELESRKFIDKSRTKQQRTLHGVYYIRSQCLQSIFRLLLRGHTIYLHWRGAFGVARFDLSGNARASIREASDRTGSTLFYMYRLRG